MDDRGLAPLLCRAAAAGAFAGALNAAHCWATLPDLKFAWHIVPAGAAHGALLALFATLFSALALDRGVAVRLLLWPVAGWAAGYASFAALNLSLDWKWDMFAVWTEPAEAYWPFQAFGLVAALAFFAWGLLRRLRAPRLVHHLAYAMAAGAGGSLWWWLSMEKPHWYYCIPHGVVWGTAVGLAVWSVYRDRAPETAVT